MGRTQKKFSARLLSPGRPGPKYEPEILPRPDPWRKYEARARTGPACFALKSRISFAYHILLEHWTNAGPFNYFTRTTTTFQSVKNSPITDLAKSLIRSCMRK
ncbi:hypothetical protein V6Z11_1Z117700 [Gossypium hirsutum]